MARSTTPTRSVTVYTPEAKKDLYDKITIWLAAKAKAAEWTQKEMALRKELFAENFPEPQEGTNNLNLEFGKQLKVTHNITRSLVKAELEALLLIERQKLAEDPNYKSNLMPIIDTIVEYEPKLVVGEYKKLDADQQKLIADMITVKDGAPTLSLETPKT